MSSYAVFRLSAGVVVEQVPHPKALAHGPQSPSVIYPKSPVETGWTPAFLKASSEKSKMLELAISLNINNALEVAVPLEATKSQDATASAQL